MIENVNIGALPADGFFFENFVPDKRVIRDGLIFHLDAANPKSYPGHGLTWNDLTGNGNNATLINGVKHDPTSGYMIFNGIDQYCSMNVPITPAAYTFEIICYYTAVGSLPMVISTNVAAVYLRLRNTDLSVSFSVRRVNDGVQFICNAGANKVFLNKPVHIVGTFDSEYLRIYINGEETANQAIVPNSPTYSGAITDLGRYFSGSLYLAGGISMVKYYNRSLTAAEAFFNFNAKKFL